MFEFIRNLRKSESEKRQELLTAYLDGSLQAAEQARFEQMLDEDSALRADLEQQRAVKESLRDLPIVRAPRSFVLDPALYSRPAPQPARSYYPVLRTATVLALFVFIVLVSVDVFLQPADTSTRGGVDQALSARLEEGEDETMLAEPASERDSASQPMLEPEEPAAEEGFLKLEETIVVESEEMVTEAESLLGDQAPEQEAAPEVAEEPMAELTSTAVFERFLPQIEAEEPAEGPDNRISTPAYGYPVPSSRPTSTPHAAPMSEQESNAELTKEAAAQSQEALSELPQTPPALESITKEVPEVEESGSPINDFLSNIEPIRWVEIFTGLLVLVLLLSTFYLRRRSRERSP